MKKLLVVVDMQCDFVSGSLGTVQAEQIVSNVKTKIQYYKAGGHEVIFTRDTHQENYLETQEGAYLPVMHCIQGTAGHLLVPQLEVGDSLVFDKPQFASIALAEKISNMNPTEIELCGLCTDICVISNALLLKTYLPETKISVDATCCAGVTVESHQAALIVMKMCQIDVIGEDSNYV